MNIKKISHPYSSYPHILCCCGSKVHEAPTHDLQIGSSPVPAGLTELHQGLERLVKLSPGAHRQEMGGVDPTWPNQMDDSIDVLFPLVGWLIEGLVYPFNSR